MTFLLPSIFSLPLPHLLLLPFAFLSLPSFLPFASSPYSRSPLSLFCFLSPLPTYLHTFLLYSSLAIFSSVAPFLLLSTTLSLPHSSHSHPSSSILSLSLSSSLSLSLCPLPFPSSLRRVIIPIKKSTKRRPRGWAAPGISAAARTGAAHRPAETRHFAELRGEKCCVPLRRLALLPLVPLCCYLASSSSSF